MTKLQNSVVLITGATGGFGQELTRQLLELGSHLVLSDLEAAKLQAHAAASQQDASQGKILATIAADLAMPAESERLYARIRELEIAIDVLINNAGLGMYGRMDELPTEQWERLMQVNLLAPMRLSALFGRDAIARGSGHIVNISSLAGWVAPAGFGPYSSSKFGLRGFSEALAAEMRPHDVKVTVVYPFFSRTPILQSLRYGELAKSQPLPLDRWVTDPARIMKATIAGIQRDRLHVFPDRPARFIHLLKRYFPEPLTWIMDRP